MLLVLVKLLHTAITLINSVAVLYVVYCGLTQHRGWLLNLAVSLIIIETIALAAFGFVCPLQLWVRQLEGSSVPVHDMYLPGWFASNIVQVCTPLAIVGLLLVIGNAVHGHRRSDVDDPI